MTKINKFLVEIINKYKLFAISLLISFFLITLDQITKNSAYNSIFELMEKTNGIHNSIKILPILNIVLVFNKGISFGILNTSGIISIILLYLLIFITVYILYLLYKSDNMLKSIYMSLIFSGAIGNMINRFTYEAVVDFIDFHIRNWHFPAFNSADSYITIGVFLILINDFVIEKKKNNNK